MKRKILVAALLAAGVLLAIGCGRKEESKDLTQTGRDMEQDSEQDQQKSDSEQEDKDGLSFHKYSWEEITISIPDSWEGKYQVEEGEEGFSLIQSASYEKESGLGFLCGFYRIDGMIIDIPGVTALAYTDTKTYYMAEPTDVSFYYEDGAISKEYQEMYDLVYAVEASISIDKESVQYNPDEFVFPMSHTVILKEDDLLACSDNELFIARNEIYARHGRLFKDIYLSNYFESCSWYKGTLSPEEFDEAVLSQVERDNILTIKRAEEIYKEEHPYPKEYKAGSIVEEDLDGDGQSEQLQYILEEDEMHGGYSGRIIINGQEFNMESYKDVWLDNPRLTFYITDISPHYEGLEIAIMDNGPSEDPITYFFTYKDELTYIGSVGGYPFKRECGYNGFSNEGVVVGEIVMGFTHTCWGVANWRYNYEDQKLEYQDTGYYINKFEYPHHLYENLTVYMKMDEGSLTTIIPAQEEVFFRGTDCKEWVYIKGKDGSRGYVHIVDGKITGLEKAPDEVFSNLEFAG